MRWIWCLLQEIRMKWQRGGTPRLVPVVVKQDNTPRLVPVVIVDPASRGRRSVQQAYPYWKDSTR